MKKLFTSFVSILFILTLLFIQSCKKDDENPVTPPAERPTYEGSGIVGTTGALIIITDANSPIKGAYVDIPEGALSSNTNITISLAPSSIQYLSDTTSIIIRFEPDGLIFNKPVTIGIPYKNVQSTSDLKAYYYVPDENILENLPLKSVDTNNKLGILETIHFSNFLVDDDGTQASVTMYQNSGKISANILIDGFNNNQNVGLIGIPTLVWSWPFGIFNAKQAIDQATFLVGNLPPWMVLRVELMEKNDYWFSTSREVKLLAFERTGNTSSQLGGKLYSKYPPDALLSYQLDQLCTAPTQNSDQREPWFSGDPYIFNFDYQVNTQKEYFVKVKWVIANGPNFGNYILNSDATHIYSFDNYEYAKKISQLTNSTLDDNNNSIIDSYELQVNFPPNKPTNPAPTNGATNQFTNSDLTWTCTDPENDQLTYDIYLGTSSTPPLVKSDNASLSYDPGLLNQNSTYYWQIIVKDNKGNSTTGDIWNFSTSSGTNNQAPNEPSNPNPINNATYQSTSPTLSWDCSDPDGDPISYDVWLSTSNPPNVKVSSLQTEKSYNASGLNYNSNYYWQIFAKDDQGNITNGPVWKFTTTNSDVLPFNEGFESGGFNYGNWESYGTVQISSNSPYQGIYALSGGAGNWYISRSFGNLLEQSTIRSSTMIKISSVDNLLPSFQINFFSDYAYHSAIGVLFGGGGIGFSSNDIITIDANVGSGEKIGEFSTNQWFKVDIVFNLQNKLFDIYLDDILIADDFGMTDNSPTYFSIGTESNISVTKVDDILIEKLNNSSPAQPSNPIPANNETNQLP